MMQVADVLNITLFNFGKEVCYGEKGIVYYLDFGFGVRLGGGQRLGCKAENWDGL